LGPFALGILRTGNLVYGDIVIPNEVRNLLFAAIAAAPKGKSTPRQLPRYSGPSIRDSPLCLPAATFFLAGTFFAASARFRS
jgi:hypothetical protein